MKNKRYNILLTILVFLLIFNITGCMNEIPIQISDAKIMEVEAIPLYKDRPYVAINNNQPTFSEQDLTDTSFEYYSELDELGRCGIAIANVGKDIMPDKARGSIGQVKPTGWHSVKYDGVDGKYLYNRCHLIGYQLSGENANERNLVTGTRYMNVEGMLPFENMVADYVKESGNHVLYRVIPVYYKKELLVRGVQIEALSVEDKGEAISFNVFVYNVQPNIIINYQNGESKLTDNNIISNEDVEIRGNRRSKVYHMPGQNAYDEMEFSANLIIFQNEEEANAAGYRKAKH